MSLKLSAAAGAQALLVVLSLLGLRARMVMVFRDVTAPPAVSVDQRYREIADALRLVGDVRVGYWSDLPEGDMRFMQAQYALAPTLLDRGVRRRYVVADLTDQRKLDEVCGKLNLRVKQEFEGALALLEAVPSQ